MTTEKNLEENRGLKNNLREQFESEWKGGGKYALDMIKRFEPEKYWKLYSEWLEQRNKEQVEVLKEARKELITVQQLYQYSTVVQGCIEEIEEQLKKSKVSI